MTAPVRLYIPPLGAALVLRQPWYFNLYKEHRNDGLIQAYANFPKGITRYTNEGLKLLNALAWKTAKRKLRDGREVNDLDYLEVQLPEGTPLTVSRIYIRQGVESYNSVTFRTGKKVPLGKGFDGKRFWVKLADANEIVCDIIG